MCFHSQRNSFCSLCFLVSLGCLRRLADCIGVCADMWVIGMRAFVCRQGANTTGVCEGYHSFLKRLAGQMAGGSRRMDHLIWLLLSKVTEIYTARAHLRHNGTVTVSILCLSTKIQLVHMLMI